MMEKEVALNKKPGSGKSISSRIFTLFSEHRVIALVAILVLYAIVFSGLFPKTFPTFSNISKVLMSMSNEAFIVIAMTIILIMGEIDLSLGANMALGGIMCGYLIRIAEMNVVLAIIITLAVSSILGLVNGIIISKIKVNSFITTLATGIMFQGAAVWIAGPGIINFPEYFQNIGMNKFLSFQMPVWYTVIAVAFIAFLLAQTRYFRQYYYIGGNLKAAVLSGINIEKMKIIAYVIAAALASLGGIISSARFNSAMTSVGGGSELRAVTAAVIGGVSFTGGSGTMLGAAVGALFISFLNNGLVIAGIEPYWQNVVTGAILILAIVVDVISKKKKE